MKRFLAVLLALASVGCMTTKREEELKASIARLETKLNDTNSQLANKDKSIETVRSESENTQKHFQATKSDIEDLRKEMSLSQGAIDELRVKLSRVQESASKAAPVSSNGGAAPAAAAKNQEMDDFLIQVSRRLAHVEMQNANLRDRFETMRKERKPEKYVSKYKTVSDLGKVLAAAFVAKDYKKVVALATPVISSEPPADRLEVALQFRGEAYFAQQEYQRAANDFSEFLDKFPRSEKRPRALLLSGDSYFYLKQPYTAKSFYSECVKNFADKDECKASKDRLDRMGL